MEVVILNEYILQYILNLINEKLDGWSYLHLLYSIYQEIITFDNVDFEDVVADVLQEQIHIELLEVFDDVPELKDMTLDLMKIYLPYSEQVEKVLREKMKKVLVFDQKKIMD